MPINQYDGFARRFASVLGVPTSSIPSFTYALLRTRLGVSQGPGDLMQVLTKLSEIPDSATGKPLVVITDFTPGTGGSVSIITPVLLLTPVR